MKSLASNKKEKHHRRFSCIDKNIVNENVLTKTMSKLVLVSQGLPTLHKSDTKSQMNRRHSYSSAIST